MSRVTDLFLKYVSFETASDENSTTYPSTKSQLVLLSELKDELIALGLNAEMDEYDYVTALLPTNLQGNQPTVCFIAHVDTSPAVSDDNVQARTIVYDGNDVDLGGNGKYILNQRDFPELKDYIGKELIVTDGETLLGADDKAGVAEIMAAVEYLLQHDEIKRPNIKVAFTPDEEIGGGVKYFNVEKFNADFGYTIDGGKIGEINYECFNAYSALVEIKGISVHPGSAFGKMINAVDVFADFHALLPATERPSTTKEYQGFYMVDEVCGCIDKLTAKYILRDHDKDKIIQKVDFIQNCAVKINEKYGKDIVSVCIKKSYSNMKEGIEGHMFLIEKAKQAFKQNGIEPFVQPIRGGTDGASLTFMGLPCPNLSTGGHNFHGRYEYIPIESMEKMADTIVTLSQSFAK